MTVKRLRERQAEATRDLLVDIARERFTEQGFATTSIEDITQRAGVAKGALYHHFNGKEALFSAVYETVLAEAMAKVVTAASRVPEPWGAARAGLSAFLDACLEPSFRRIVILDSISLLQGDAATSGIEHRELPMLRIVLTPLVAAEVLPGVKLEPLVHVALGGLYGAALYIARSSRPKVARREADAVLDTLLHGLRTATAQPEATG